ncbi:hypothetical protein [Roseibacillus persicicus]|uniref:Uncharacterized protein n=1 Tax=Roseibacillus persicicus TaxID=454148 RepID=A0A918WPP2_9BACT|nr:hypothetical protein [Roseibacillus persicicus]MDQ8189283.1 hypothetical protein [Roseibacillus persicicus]GHC65582.1 hypothetical protein GCM10007100_36740 [Roseibacillus persicicus]
MEFKVIFIGFALHCVLNTVLICKSVITKDQEEKAEIVMVQEEQQMLQSLNDGNGDFKRLRLQVDNTDGETSILVR